ncbi:MAG: DUF1080 domain-containing protein [Pirellulales bacterium]
MKHTTVVQYVLFSILALSAGISIATGEEILRHKPTEEWISLFNGHDLSGWTVKITGHPIGKNFANTFRVEEGILKVSYDNYELFDDQYGHLYANVPYSHYRLRMEYRFIGEMMKDAPKYVNLNSGLMIHSQSPQSMKRDQKFPVSLEFQFLADEGTGKRPTGNVCTPGTNIEIDGNLVTQHIVQSSGPTFPAHEWVRIEIEVRGNDRVIHRVNGQEVLRYEHPQLDPEGRVESTDELIASGSPSDLHFGFIALQAEGQPVWFRNIELQSLE